MRQLAILACLMVGGLSSAQAQTAPTPQTVTFDTAGPSTWTVPARVNSIRVEAIGGGGGGGGATQGARANGGVNPPVIASWPGGIGGSGARVIADALSVNSGETLSIVVAAGGAGGANSWSDQLSASGSHYSFGGLGGGFSSIEGSSLRVVAGGGGGGGNSSVTNNVISINHYHSSAGGSACAATASGGTGGSPTLPITVSQFTGAEVAGPATWMIEGGISTDVAGSPSAVSALEKRSTGGGGSAPGVTSLPASGSAMRPMGSSAGGSFWTGRDATITNGSANPSGSNSSCAPANNGGIAGIVSATEAERNGTAGGNGSVTITYTQALATLTPPASGGPTGSALTSGGTAISDALAGTELDGQPATLATVTLTPVSSTNPGVTLDPITGQISVAPNLPVGRYSVTYDVCDIVYPTTCITLTANVNVAAPAAVPVNNPLALLLLSLGLAGWAGVRRKRAVAQQAL